MSFVTMIARLLLIKNADFNVSSFDYSDESVTSLWALLLLGPIAMIILLPLVWKFVFLFILILTVGYLINELILKQPEELPQDFIDLHPHSIATTVNDIETKFDLSVIASLEILSNYYTGYFSHEQKPLVHDGHMQIIIRQKDGSEIVKQCLINNELQYKSVTHAIRIWYNSGVPIKEYVTMHKYPGLLLVKQSNYSYADLKAAKAELGIS